MSPSEARAARRRRRAGQPGPGRDRRGDLRTATAPCSRSSPSRSAPRPTTSPSTGRCSAACERAAEHGATEIEVINDSELVARQLNGVYKVKHPAMRAAVLSRPTRRWRGFERWQVRNVPRAENARADALVNAALDAAHDFGARGRVG